MKSSEEIQTELDALWVEYWEPGSDKSAIWAQIIEKQEQLSEAKKRER